MEMAMAMERESNREKNGNCSRFIYFDFDILKRQMQLIRFFGARSHQLCGTNEKKNDVVTVVVFHYYP